MGISPSAEFKSGATSSRDYLAVALQDEKNRAELKKVLDEHQEVKD